MIIKVFISLGMGNRVGCDATVAVGFFYRTDISPWNFLLATIGTAVLALLTVSRKVFKAIRAKPVQSLRYE